MMSGSRRSAGRTRRVAILSGVAAVLSLVTTASAQTYPKEGAYDFTACWSGTSEEVQFTKTHTASSYVFTGTTRTNPPGGLFDRHTFRCVGAGASLGGKNSGMTVCEAIDKDGDKRLSYFTNTPDGNVVREANVQGTGKYEGMEMRGTVKPLGPFPTIKPGTLQNCNHQTGTYKLK